MPVRKHYYVLRLHLEFLWIVFFLTKMFNRLNI